MRLSFTQIDAFADRPFTGNPAAVMPLHAWLDDDLLQKIAAENNLSETAFLVPIAGSEDELDMAGGGDAPDYELRWFTPTSEVVLCGHATLASGHWVLSAAPDRERVRFRTRNAGELTVTRAEHGAPGYELTLPAWKPSPKPLPEIVAALGLDEVRETLWHEHRYGLVVVDRPDQVVSLKPDFAALAAQGDVLTIVTAPAEHSAIISRVFAPGAGIDEDPVTGSAHAVMVPYWAERLGRAEFSAYQASARGGHLDCRLEGERVILGGNCVTVIDGSFLLD